MGDIDDLNALERSSHRRPSFSVPQVIGHRDIRIRRKQKVGVSDASQTAEGAPLERLTRPVHIDAAQADRIKPLHCW
jgi:hypothetical protein